MNNNQSKINIGSLETMLIDLVKPTIKEFYQEKNPSIISMWDQNCYLQSVIVVANIMNSSIKRLGYETKAYYGKFTDLENGNQIEYNHCWVYCRNVHDKTKSVLIDIARSNKKDIVMLRETNTYDKKVKGYEFQYLKEYQEIDYIATLQENEEVTQQKTQISYNEIVKRISNQKLLKTK